MHISMTHILDKEITKEPSVSCSYSSPPWLGTVEIDSPTNLGFDDHIPLITEPSLR
jgi:hypothetical protein